MKRRDFLKKTATGAVIAGAAPAVLASGSNKKIHWRMATSWPKSLDTIYGGAVTVAKRVSELTNGNFRITPYAGGELVGGLGVFDAVSQGTVEMGHTASYYYIGKNPVFAFDTALPFGLTYRQQNAWLYKGGGGELLSKSFADFNIKALPAGNTGVQMGGWFRKEVNTVADLKGLKMRIPGLGGKVMSRLGATVQVIPGGEIYPALERGVIDATEWIGPYDDEKLGFYKVAKYYYAPGWWEPAPTLSLYINSKKWDSLPKEYQEAVTSAAADANISMMVDYDTKNPAALARLLSHGVELKSFSDEIMKAAHKESFALYDELSAKHADYKKVFVQWNDFRKKSNKWMSVAEQQYADFAYKS